MLARLAPVIWLLAVAQPPAPTEVAASPVALVPATDSISLADVGLNEPAQAALAGTSFVWVTGPRQGIAIADLAAGTARAFGRIGSGPGELRSASRVFGCAEYGGWIDAQLARATWMRPDGRGTPTITALPSATLGRGRILDAWCKADTLWYSVERPTTGSAAVVDSLLVFRAAKSGERVDTLARLPGTHRVLRSQGPLQTASRLPFTAPPVAVAGRSGPVVVWRRVDSLSTDANRLGRPNVAIRGGRNQALTSAHVGRIRDSMKRANEHEMEALQYSADLRREFRRLFQDVIDGIDVPRSLPTTRSAVVIPGRADHLLVVENALPGDQTICTSLLPPSGVLTQRICSASANRSFGAVVHTGRDLWWVEWNDDDAWIRRQTRR